MEDKIQSAFDSVRTSEHLLRRTRAHIRRKTFDYGRRTAQHQAHRRRLAECMLCLVLTLGFTGLWFIPATSIGLDINPSLELTVNALDRVIALKGKNEDGMKVAQRLDVSGLPYDEAMQRILISEELEPYLEGGSMISISVVGCGNEDHAEQILSKVVCRAYSIAEKENVFYCQTDGETLAAARASGLCIPRYLAWQRLLETDPTVTAEDVSKMSTEEIRAVAQLEMIDNPCGE